MCINYLIHNNILNNYLLILIVYFIICFIFNKCSIKIIYYKFSNYCLYYNTYNINDVQSYNK